MNADRQPGCTRKPKLHREKFPLEGTPLRVFFPVVVEADLADRDDLRMLCPCEELLLHLVRRRAGALRVNADGSVERGIALCVCNCLRGRRHRIAHADDLPDARLCRACDRLGQIICESLVIKMSMCVDQLHHHSVSIRGNNCSAVPTAWPSGRPPHAASESCTASKSVAKPS